MRVPETWRSARATIILAVLIALAWLLASGTGNDNFAAIWGGFIPERVAGLPGDHVLAPVWLTPLTATLVHAGIIHLAFNLLILVYCGRAVESILGPAGLLILYVAGAYGAAGAHYLLHIDNDVPMVGASGAISAILGAYALMFSRNRVKLANHRLAVLVNALWLGAAWVVLQLLTGFTFETVGTRIAIGAHIGGFLVGLLLVKPLLLLRYRGA